MSNRAITCRLCGLEVARKTDTRVIPKHGAKFGEFDYVLLRIRVTCPECHQSRWIYVRSDEGAAITG